MTDTSNIKLGLGSPCAQTETASSSPETQQIYTIYHKWGGRLADLSGWSLWGSSHPGGGSRGQNLLCMLVELKVCYASTSVLGPGEVFAIPLSLTQECLAIPVSLNKFKVNYKNNSYIYFYITGKGLSIRMPVLFSMGVQYDYRWTEAHILWFVCHLKSLHVSQWDFCFCLFVCLGFL